MLGTIAAILGILSIWFFLCRSRTEDVFSARESSASGPSASGLPGPELSSFEPLASDPTASETAPELSEPIPVKGDVQAPRLIRAPAPRYTEIARKARIQGDVIVRAIVEEDGTVRRAEVLKDLPMGLGEQAVETVMTWRFQPATLNGQPVVVYHDLAVEFRLP